MAPRTPAHCGATHAVGVSERRGHHTHHPRCRPMCPLSPLTRHATPATLSQMPRLTSLTHTWRALCGSSHPHTHTHWLADCPHALHTPPPLGVRVLIHLLSSATHTHTHTGRTGVAHAWVVAGVVTTTTPLVPHHHTHTQRDWWCGPWWCLVVCVCPVCASHATITLAFPPTTTTNALVPPPPSHTHGTWCMHHCHTHTRHMHHHTHQGVLCVDHTMPHPPPPTPSPHSHTHTTWHTHTASATLPQWCLPSLTTPSTHTQLMPHTHHTGDRPRPSTPLAVAFREPPPPRWSCPFALLSSLLLVHQPLFSLSSMHSHAPHVLITTTMPSIPCVCCVLWGWTAPSTTVVVKHATHTLVDHCVDGSHHPTLHPPSTLTPFCAFATTNHHAIPLLQPSHTTRPLCSSTAHSSASHTHMVWMACAFVAALTSCVWCVWMACTSHHIVHTHSHNHCGFAHRHTTTKPMVWMACTVTMVWHKRGCGVVLPSSLVQHVVAPTPSKWPRAHHTALQPPQHPCFLVSTHVPQPVHTHPHVCV